MNRNAAGILTFVILFSLWTNSARPPVAAQNEHAAASAQSTLPEDKPPKMARSPSPPTGSDDAFSNYSEELQDALQGFYAEKLEDKKRARGCPVPEINKELVYRIKLDVPRVLLAIVPDPVHTHLGLFFDRQIDAIQQAAQDNGYYFDRAIMPWNSRELPESTDFRVRLQQEHYQRCREKEPGLMIFRRGMYGEKGATFLGNQENNNQVKKGDVDENRVSVDLHQGALLVFVVGETPTSGIHRDQFQEAIGDMRALFSSRLPTLQILGPTFSGSLFSLRALIESNKKDFGAFQVYSGTANSYESIQQFLKSGSDPAKRTTFASFQESAELQELLFVKFLQGRGYSASQIAILSEDETSYGGFGMILHSTNSGKGGEEKRSCFPNCLTNTDESYEQIQRSVVHVYFPREIAQLRSAYQREVAVPRSGGSEKEFSRSTLKLDLTDSGSDDDSVQTYSHRQLPLSQEAVLLGIVTTLHKHAIEFVILRSTDPLDTVFLARYLRSASPNLRIVTTGNDLLLRREIEDRLLFGILSINTYSMRPGADDLLSNPTSWPLHQDRVFPGPDSVGTYNAMTALLWPSEAVEKKEKEKPNRECKPSDLIDGRIRFGCDVRLEEYGWPSLGGPIANGTFVAPPVWVTVLGRDGFWPVALLTPPATVMDPNEPVSRLPLLEQRPPAPAYKPPTTWAWRALCGFMVLIAVLYIWLLRNGSVLSTSQVSQELAVRAGDCRIVAFAVQGLLLLTAVSLVWWPWLHGRVEGCWLWGATLGATALILLVVFAVDLRRRWSRSHARSLDVAIAALLFVLVGGLLWSLLLCPGDDAVTNMYIYRYVHTAWWVSPLTPVLLLIGAGVWWSWYTIQGAALLDERRPLLPKAQELTGGGVPLVEAPPDRSAKAGASQVHPAQAGERTLPAKLRYLSEDEPEMKELLAVLTPGMWSHRVRWLVIAFVGLAVLMSDYCHPVSSLEGQWFDRVFGILLVAALGILFSSLLRLYFIWTDTKRFLVRLDATRLRYGFSRLPGYAWMPFWGLGGSPLPDRERLVRLEVEALQTAIATIVNSNRPELEKRLNEISKAMEELQDDRTDASRLEHVRDLYGKIASAAGAMLGYLTEKWKTEKYRESANATEAAEDFVALVYASFIQVILIRMRSLIICLCGMFVFIVASLNVYPFGPKGSLNSLSILLLLVITAVIGLVFSQLRRDATLSRITDTKEGKLGADFWLKLAQFGALPLLSLLTSLYPEVGSFLFSWLEPAAQALGK
jgi:hypothetical protein